MEIPELLQVSETTSVNPANIAVFKDYSNRLEIYTLGGTKIEVRGDWIEPTRRAILKQIPDEPYKTTATGSEDDAQTVDFIQLDDKLVEGTLCSHFGGCIKEKRYNEDCSAPSDFLCFFHSTADNGELEIDEALNETIVQDLEAIADESESSIDKSTEGEAEIEERHSATEDSDTLCENFFKCEDDDKRLDVLCSDPDEFPCYIPPKS